jgi:N-hydroxyarylamine O-acetyltransferase
VAADLRKYFARIGYDGDASASRPTLEAICELHPAAIPFENLDPLLRRPPSLDHDALEAKLLDAGRGGYCFEHNLLLAEVLRTLGFDVTQLAARVLWGAPPGRVGPRSHMLLRVELDGEPVVVDVGFGGLTLTGVLRLQPDVEQTTPHEPFRLREQDGGYVMEARTNERWGALYRFDMHEQLQADYEVSSWFLCTNPKSPFIQMLMGARTYPGGRHAIRDNVWTIHDGSGIPRRTVLDRPADLRSVLVETFGITLPSGNEVDRLIAELASRSADTGA